MSSLPFVPIRRRLAALRKTLMRLAPLAAALFVLAGCAVPAAVNPPDPSDDRPQWTFLVYMAADNNLDDAALVDFLEMASVGSSDKVNIVVQLDLAAGSTWSDTRRFLIARNGTYNDAPLANLGEVNMGDPASLRDFITWGVATYPAHHTFLSIWNHGGGWRVRELKRLSGAVRRDGSFAPASMKAVAWDDADSDHLFMDEVEAAITDGETQTQTKLDVIGFDACLMGMVEVAYELRDLANYMVGSENFEPGEGWPYDTILDDLAARPDMSPAELATAVVDRYGQSLALDVGITQSAVDLAYIQYVAVAIDSFAATLTTDWSALAAARSATLEYHATNIPTFWGADLWQFADQVETLVNSQDLRAAARSVKTALDQFVIAENHTADMAGSHGMAIYFPPTRANFVGDVDSSGYTQLNTFMPVDFVADHEWDEWLGFYYAHGAVDQASSATAGTTIGCGVPAMGVGSLFQGFTPTQSTLTGVTLRFRPGGSFPYDTSFATTVHIRAGAPNGPVLASSTRTVVGDADANNAFFAFNPAVTLTPGQSYLIEWPTPMAGDSILTWYVAQDNPYPGGTAYGCPATPIPEDDFVFQTHSWAN